MNASHPRETFIALRARKQGHQIATEVLNPPMEIPPELRPAVRAEPIDPFEGKISYQPDYSVYSHYESADYSSPPRWMWAVLGLEIVALLLAILWLW